MRRGRRLLHFDADHARLAVTIQDDERLQRIVEVAPPERAVARSIERPATLEISDAGLVQANPAERQHPRRVGRQRAPAANTIATKVPQVETARSMT